MKNTTSARESMSRDNSVSDHAGSGVKFVVSGTSYNTTPLTIHKAVGADLRDALENVFNRVIEKAREDDKDCSANTQPDAPWTLDNIAAMRRELRTAVEAQETLMKLVAIPTHRRVFSVGGSDERKFVVVIDYCEVVS